MKKGVCILCGLVLLTGLYAAYLRGSPITKLEIVPASVCIEPGVSMSLITKGYTDKGLEATAEQLEKISVQLEYESKDGAFTVDEFGYLTAIHAGIGNVQIRTNDGSILCL